MNRMQNFEKKNFSLMKIRHCRVSPETKFEICIKEDLAKNLSY